MAEFKTDKELIELGIERGFFEIRGDKITYKPKTPEAKRDDFRDSEEKVRAALYVELVEKYKYPLEQIDKPDKYIKIGHPDKKTDVKIDLLVKKDKNPFMLFELKGARKKIMKGEWKVQLRLNYSMWHLY